MEIMTLSPKAVVSNREKSLRTSLRWARAAFYSALGVAIMDLGWLLQGNLFGLVALIVWGFIAIAKYTQMKTAERALEDHLLEAHGPAAITVRR